MKRATTTSVHSSTSRSSIVRYCGEQHDSIVNNNGSIWSALIGNEMGRDNDISPKLQAPSHGSADKDNSLRHTGSGRYFSSRPSLMAQQRSARSEPDVLSTKLYGDPDADTQHATKKSTMQEASRLLEAHRRQRSKVWSRKLRHEPQDIPYGPIVTSPFSGMQRACSFSKDAPKAMPPSNVRVHSISKAETTLQLQDRQMAPIPGQVELSDAMDVSSLTTHGSSRLMDDGTFDDDLSMTPSFYHDSPGGYATHLSSSPVPQRAQPRSSHQKNRATMGGAKFEPKPLSRALDKSFLKKMASEHRSRMIATGNRMARNSSHHGNCSSFATFASESRNGSSHHQPRVFVSTSPKRGSRSSNHQSKVSATTPPPRHSTSPVVVDSGNCTPPTSNSTAAVCPSPPPPASSNNATMVEVWPGVTAPLRGSDETKAAVAKDFYTSVVCFECSTRIYCIADVQLTICPVCRGISHVDQASFRGQPLRCRWGLGLGFTLQGLGEMQRDIATAAAVGV